MRNTFTLCGFILMFSTQLAQALDSGSVGIVNVTTTKAQQNYTLIEMPPSVTNAVYNNDTGIGAFVKNIYNLCNTTTNRDACFVQYRVQLNNGIYTQLNSSLQCPKGYVTGASLGNSALDVTAVNDQIFYYESLSKTKVTNNEYNVYKNMPGACTYEPTSYTYRNDCSWQDCGLNRDFPDILSGGANFYTTVDPDYAVYVFVYPNGSKGMYNSAPLRCQEYTGLIDCSKQAACTSCNMNIVYFKWVDCNLPAGYYKYNPASSAPISTSHTPSTLVCVKPKTEWQKAPSS